MAEGSDAGGQGTWADMAAAEPPPATTEDIPHHQEPRRRRRRQRRGPRAAAAATSESAASAPDVPAVRQQQHPQREKESAVERAARRQAFAERRQAQRDALHAALKRALRAMMTEYSQERYGGWWLSDLDTVLRNRLHDGFAEVDPDLKAIGVVRDIVGGWWRWTAKAPHPTFKADARRTCTVPRRRAVRLTKKPGESADEFDARLMSETLRARDADDALYRDALQRALRALMTDYSQEHHGGVWWAAKLDGNLRKAVRAARFGPAASTAEGVDPVDPDLLHIDALRRACRGWWRWIDGADAPSFWPDERGEPPLASPQTRHLPPHVSKATRRARTREQEKRRPPGSAVRARPLAA